MNFLDPATMTAYSDLHKACREPAFDGKGVSFTKKTVNGNDYWYTNSKIGRTPRQQYLGPDTEDTRALMAREQELWEGRENSRSLRARLVNVVLAGGMPALPPQEGRILRLLERAGVFLAGGVLVGTPAFKLLGNALGVTWERDHQTRDIDLAFDHRLPIAVPAGSKTLEEVLKESNMGFMPIPALNRKSPSTKYKISGDDYSVDLLTPEIGKPAELPVKISQWGVVAKPLRFLDYLIEETELVTAPFDIGLLLVLPSPGRFAFHKLVVSQRRNKVVDAIKIRKDIDQADQLIQVLADIRPGALIEAHDRALEVGGKFVKELEQGMSKLPKETQKILKELT